MQKAFLRFHKKPEENYNSLTNHEFPMTQISSDGAFGWTGINNDFYANE